MIAPDIDKCVTEIGKSSYLQTYFTENRHTLEFKRVRGVNGVKIPEEILFQEDTIQKMNSLYKISHGAILTLDSHICFNWHIDQVAGCRINLLLTPQDDSRVMFRHEQPNENPWEYAAATFQYQPNTFYLFNTQLSHTVINGNKPRYMVTVEFVQTRQTLNYEMVLSKLSQLDK